MHFKADSQGHVTACFDCREADQGYTGVLHGGIISLFLDGAMTNCLFAKKIKAVTGELTVRFLHPVAIQSRVIISAYEKKSSPPLHYLEAELSQNGIILAKAKGKFMEVAEILPVR